MTELQLPSTPKRYRPAVNVKWAKILPGQPAFIKRKRASAKYRAGIKYEREVHDHLSLLALAKPWLKYVESPWIEFEDDSGRRWCQADALLVDDKQKAVVIAEVKYQHTADAWWQLVHLYRPVVAVLYPTHRPICLLEIVHYYDPQVQWPERFDLTNSPFVIPHANRVAVHIFNPKRRRSRTGPSDGLALDGHTLSQSVSPADDTARVTEGAK